MDATTATLREPPATYDASRKIYSVAQLTQEIKLLFDGTYPFVWVEGEVSNLRCPQSGHMYFTLKDAKAQLACVLFQRARARQVFQLQEGLQVLCAGRISVYEAQGKYQLYVERMEPKGWGALQLAFEQRKQTLARAGLFEEQRKRPLPFFPERVGVITSPSGEAIHDFLRHVEYEAMGLHVLIVPARVQGVGAAQEMVDAIQALHAWHARMPVDVIVLVRGGGSIEDLWEYNEEVLARAMFHSTIVVMTGIAHTENCTIADLVADVRANTPTNAADLIKERKQRVMEQIVMLRDALQEAVRERLEVCRHRVEVLNTHYALRQPAAILDEWQQRVDEWQRRVAQGLQHQMTVRQHRFERARERLDALSPRQRLLLAEQRFAHLSGVIHTSIQHAMGVLRSDVSRAIGELDALSPLAILSRGYSVTFVEGSERVVRDAKDVSVNAQLRTRLAHGTVVSRVETIQEEERQ